LKAHVSLSHIRVETGLDVSKKEGKINGEQGNKKYIKIKVK